MSLTQIDGDLLDWQAGDYKWNVAVHCVNCKGVMGSGLAKAIRDKYPSSYEDYRKAFEANELKLGEFVVSQVDDGNHKIVHLAGQWNYGTDRRHLNYEAFYSGMEDLKKALEEAVQAGRPYSLGIPYGIGCGLAGGEWTIVESMLRFLLDKSLVPCYIVRLSSKS